MKQVWAKGKLDTPILGVALGIELKDASTGPFAQFQNCGDDEESLTKLVFQLVNRIPNSEPDRDTIKFQVGKFKQSISSILKRLDEPKSKADATTAEQDIRNIENSSVKLFEEIKIMFQDLPSRIERAAPSEGKRRRRRIHPGMLEEMVHMAPDGKLGLRIALSLYRDKMPWIYDEGILLLRKIENARTPATFDKCRQELEYLLRITRNPVVEELLIDDKEDYYLLKELPRMILRNLDRLLMEARQNPQSMSDLSRALEDIDRR